MRSMWTFALLALPFGVAMASLDPERNYLDPSPRPSHPQPAYDGREGGEDIPSAFIIPSDVSLLPFSDAGATCDNVNDYDEACPYTESTAPDVVYRFTPSADVSVSVDLCASMYNTKTYVYEEAAGNLVACNDNAGCGYSGYQSFIYDLHLTGGVDYYIVIDGHRQSCGTYIVTLARYEPCVVECPVGGQPEGEPPCEDGYDDEFNSGCNGLARVWSPIEAGPDGCSTICGKSCTYIFQGMSYRDTDWYEATAAGGPVTVTCEAEFPLHVILIWWTDCSFGAEGEVVTAPPCHAAEVSHGFVAGEELWLWVGPQVIQGIPESDYVFTICGLTALPTPVKAMTWGAIKSTYRAPIK